MDLFAAFILFVMSILGMLITGKSIAYGLLTGYVLFLLVGRRRGHSFGRLFSESLHGIKNAMVVIRVLIYVGILIAVWRMCGTIAFFVYYGISLIPSQLFLLCAFLLTCFVSYLIGSAFGVAGTMGVILMTLSRSGGVDPVITGGVLLAGIYFGDRCSPVSSSASLVAEMTKTKLMDNVREMMKTGLLPFLLSCLIYLGISLAHPLQQLDGGAVDTIGRSFELSMWTVIPAVFVLVLPVLKVNVRISMAVSALSGMVIACLVQGLEWTKVLKFCVFGYEAAEESLGGLFDGGGILSMAHVAAVVLISCACAGVFNGTGMADGIHERMTFCCEKYGRFLPLAVISMASTMLFCNQSLSIVLNAELFREAYDKSGGSREELAVDLENSVVLSAALVPWSIACAVPLAFFGVGIESIIFAVYLYLVPVCHGLMKWRKGKK